MLDGNIHPDYADVASSLIRQIPRDRHAAFFAALGVIAVVVRQELCTRLVQAAEKCSKCAEYCPTEAIELF